MKREEAIEVIKKNWPDSSFTMLREALETLIPELKESEDERICGKLIAFLKQCKAVYGDVFNQFGLDIDKALAWLEKQSGQKPAGWSDKDERNLTGIQLIIESWDKEHNSPDGIPSLVPEYCRWFKALKNRVQSQSEQEWSEEDNKNMKECVIAVSMSEGHTREEKEQLEDWLKYHLSQKQCGYNPYKEVVESIAEMCEKYKLPTSNLSDFLDNVMVKCKEAKEYDVMFPQTTWKPSDEQMAALNNAILLNEGHYNGAVLSTLREQLKKLKG